MIKTSRKELFRKKLIRFGKKNFICKFLTTPILLAGTILFSVMGYVYNNKKRYAVMAFTFFLFAVYSSFSFPIFISGNESKSFDKISEEAKDIVLATETKVDLEAVDILEDKDVLNDGEELTDSECNLNQVEHYSSNDILELNQNRTNQTKTDNVGESGEQEYEFSKDDWKLILINKQNSIPDGYEDSVPLGNINTMKGVMHCDERIIDDLLDMIQAAKDDGVSLVICSPYRDLEYQRMLFERKIKKYMQKGLSYMEAYQLSSQAVTVPNASEHQIGLALDIVTNNYTSLNEGFGETDAGIWLNEKSYKYGFILRYPKGKEEITGIEFEPWHFRYVGKEAAKIIKEKEITLEEFWEDL